MKTIVTIMLCLFGMNSIAAVSSKQVEVNSLLTKWGEKWNIPANKVVTAFIAETGANPIINTMADAIAFESAYKAYVAQWLKKDKASHGLLRAAYNRAGKITISSIRVKQTQILNKIQKWAKRWNITTNPIESFATLTNTNPIISTVEEATKFNLDYLRYLVQFDILANIESIKKEQRYNAENVFILQYQQKAKLEMEHWIQDNCKDDTVDAEELFKQYFNTSTDINSIDQAVAFQYNVVTLPQYYKLGIDKVNP
jgi:hypothetical protein